MSNSTITPVQLGQLCQQFPDINLIDVRTPVEFREVHLNIARNIPLDQPDCAQLMKTRSAGASEPLFVIC